MHLAQLGTSMKTAARGTRLGLVALLALGHPVSTFGQSPATPAIRPAPPAAQTATAPPARPVGLDEAVRLALEQNLSIQVERLNPQIEDLTVAQARTPWTPSVSTGLTAFSQDSPANSFLSGGQAKVSDDQFSTNVSVNQLLPRGGGSYSVSWNSSRSTTTNIFTNFNPVLRSNVTASYVQPLVRNFSIDAPRQQLLVSKKNREMSDVQLRQTIVSTVRNVKNAYWDLVFAISSLEVQRQSLDLARESLRNNKTRVEVGTMAPIDIVEAEAEVARNDEAVILAEAAIDQAQDRLRALVFDPSQPNFWTTRLQPTDAPTLQMQAIDVDVAVRSALDKRTDLQRARKSLELSDVNIRYFRNQILPDVNFEATYGLAGLGGTQFQSFSGFPTPGQARPVIGQRRFGSVLSDIFANDFPTWTFGVTVGYPIGTSTAEASLARARLQYTQAQTQIKNLELQVATEVRDVGRRVNTNLKRVDATRAARQLSERRLEAEQKKFAVGMSTSFLVFQAQRDLAQARNNELRATLDSNQALVDFEAVQEAALGGSGGIIVAGTGSAGAAGVGSAGAGVGDGSAAAASTAAASRQR